MRKEYLHEEDEVFEGSVEVRLLAELHHLGEVLVVDVRVHAEQTLQDRLGHRQEVLGERHACNSQGVTTTRSLATYTVMQSVRQVPILEGNRVSSSSWSCAHVMR